MECFDYLKRCSTCDAPDRYCATYTGPRFGKSGKAKIFFLGLDGGKDDGHVKSNVDEWRNAVLAHYRNEQNPWNPHYRACVQITAGLSEGMDCNSDCHIKCSGHPEQDCALAQFAQGNAVKCVRAGNTTMQFSQSHLVASCLPLGLEELASLEPDVIILQSRSQLEDRVYELLSPFFGTFERETYTDWSAVFTWKTQKQSIVVSTDHPAYAVRGFGSFDAYMEQHVGPRLQTVQRWLSDR